MRQTFQAECGRRQEETGSHGLAFQGEAAECRGREERHPPELVCRPTGKSHLVPCRRRNSALTKKLQDWVKSREAVDADHIPQPEPSAEEQSKAAAKPIYIPVPEPASGINNVCPICQEKFENKWLDYAQEWVWLDAVLVRNRAYHASCYKEATRDRESTPGASRRTPEPILGKRKAEGGLLSPKPRTLKTAY